MSRVVREDPPAAAALATLGRLADDAPSDPDAARQRVRTFRRFLLLYVAARSGVWAALAPEAGALGSAEAAALGLCAVLGAAGAALAWSPAPRWERRAAWIVLPAVLFHVVWRFPYGANHLYLELLLLGLVCLDGDRPADTRLVQRSLRWLVALVLFQTGLQKVLYGHYWRGDFLALMVGDQERFARFFRLLLPDGELARLAALDRLETGAGPYRVEAWPFRLASASVVVAELVLPGLLLARPTRRLAVAGAVALMAGIQLAALEVGFALLFVNALLLFLPPAFGRAGLAAAVPVLGWGLGAAWGLLPGDPADWNLM